jgi:uncharacterized membrane protein YtjA (UPF0391 family)
MRPWALAFLLVAIIFAAFGFTPLGQGAREIAQTLFVVFTCAFLIALVASVFED